MSEQRSSDMQKYNNSVALEDHGSVDGRLFAPSAGRNKAILATHLSEILPQQAKVLEIASGTGEHGAELIGLRPDICWQYSDPSPESRNSAAAWAAHICPKAEGTGLLSPLDLDMCADNWAQDLAQYDAVFSANMIHIAPWEAALGLAANAGTVLADNGVIWLYGPFLEEQNSAPSNLDFDASLKRRNSSWGVRSIESVKHIFAKHEFNQISRRDLPKNNLLLGFSR
ncbi:MAG: DUF938 domain-containing protein [Litorimonas sp.]